MAAAAVGAVLAASVAACGGGGSSGASPGTSVAPGSTVASSTASASITSTPMPTAGAAAQAAVKADWEAFFNAKTPTARRVMLMQDGPAFAKVLAAQAQTQLAASATATVSKVTLVSPARANVTYSIAAGGQTVLANESGVAVYQDGVWKVGVASFCGLLALESGGNTSSLPAACQTSG